MNKIEAIFIDKEGTAKIVNVLKPMGCCSRFDKSILFIDNIIHLSESMELSSVADDGYFAIKICEENRGLIEKIMEFYESKT